MWNFLKNLFVSKHSIAPEHFPGLLEDTRSLEEKEKDLTHYELVLGGIVSTPVAWKSKNMSEWRSFPIYNQKQTSACVAYATTKVLAIENYIEEGVYVDLSKRDFYNRRVNKPEPGMNFYDAQDIAKKWGATLEMFMPSFDLTEAEMNKADDRKNSYIRIGKIFASGGYVTMPINIDAIASVSQSGKGILLGFTFTYAEWQSVPRIVGFPDLRHAVTGVDTTMYMGEKALIIEDSWGLEATEFKGRRIITESFLKARCIYAGYMIDLSNAEPGTLPKPKHTFTSILKFGNENHPDIFALQDVLRYEGLFPKDQISTGKYFQLTARGVMQFKARYRLVGDGNMVDGAMISVLNQLYA